MNYKLDIVQSPMGIVRITIKPQSPIKRIAVLFVIRYQFPTGKPCLFICNPSYYFFTGFEIIKSSVTIIRVIIYA